MKKEEIEKLQPCSLKQIQSVMLDIMRDIDKVCNENNIPYWISDGTLLGCIRHGGFIPWDDDMDIAMTYDDYMRFMNLCGKKLGEKYFIQTYKSDSNYNITGVFTKVRDKHSIFIEDYNQHYQQGAYIDIFILNRYNENSLIYKTKKDIFRLLSISKQKLLKSDGLQRKGSKLILKIIFFWLSKRTLIKLQEKADKKHKQNGNIFGYSFCTPMSTKYKFSENDIFPIKRTTFAGIEVNVPNNHDCMLKTYYGDYMKIPDEKDRHSHALFYGLKKEN